MGDAICFYTAENYATNTIEVRTKAGWKKIEQKHICLPPGNHTPLVSHLDDALSSAKIINKDYIAVVFEEPNFQGSSQFIDKDYPTFHSVTTIDDKVSSIKVLPDCNKYIWKSECDVNRTYFTGLDEKRREFCNEPANAKTNTCYNWCSNNKTECTTLNNMNSCYRYGISDTDCNREKINELEDKCIAYGLIDKDTKTPTSSSTVICSDKGIAFFEQQCKDLELKDEECVSSRVEIEKIDRGNAKRFQDGLDALTKDMDEFRQNNQKWRANIQLSIDKHADHLANMIADTTNKLKNQSDDQYKGVMDIWDKIKDDTTPPPPPPKADYTPIYIILVLCCLFIFSLFSGLGGVLIYTTQ
jgi:hypothetical protein